MNKLLLNQSARNHIKVFPMKNVFDDLPTEEADQIRWCEEQYKRLQQSDNAKRLVIYKNRSKGYLFSVWEADGLYYMIQCIRNEFKTYNDIIYITKDGEDAKSIAKFLYDNVENIMQGMTKDLIKAWSMIDGKGA